MTDQKAREIFNKLNFLFSILIPLLDKAKETSRPMKRVKFTMNEFIRAVENESNFHFDMFNNSVPVEQRNGELINAIDIWKLTDDAYEFLFDLIFNKEIGHLVNFIHFYKSAKEKGLEEDIISLQYKPVKV